MSGRRTAAAPDRRGSFVFSAAGELQAGTIYVTMDYRSDHEAEAVAKATRIAAKRMALRELEPRPGHGIVAEGGRA